MHWSVAGRISSHALEVKQELRGITSVYGRGAMLRARNYDEALSHCAAVCCVDAWEGWTRLWRSAGSGTGNSGKRCEAVSSIVGMSAQ